jgi:hypothetical protein
MRKKTKVKVVSVVDSFLVAHEVFFVEKGCTHYFNAQHKLFKLSNLERVYYDFLCEKMNARNLVQLCPKTRQDFIDFCEHVLKIEKIRTSRSLQNAENKLQKLYLLFQSPTNKNLHYINPKYAFKGTNTERKKLLARIADSATLKDEVKRAILDIELESIKPDKALLSLPYPTDIGI